MWEPLFQHGKGFLFLLPSVDRIDTVQRGFNGLRLFGEVDRLLEYPGGDISARENISEGSEGIIKCFFYPGQQKRGYPPSRISSFFTALTTTLTAKNLSS